MRKPYKEKSPEPIKFIHLSLIIEVINKDTKTKKEAKYPIHSSQFIVIIHLLQIFIFVPLYDNCKSIGSK